MDTTVKLKLGFAALMIASGIGVAMYPVISNAVAQRHASSVIESYNDTVQTMDTEKIDAAKEAARRYNEQLSNAIDRDAAGEAADTGTSYVDMLDVGESLGYITIPKIDVNLPIYEGTGDDVLLKGVGHLEGSSYPLGGAGTHSVLTGHRGLPSEYVENTIRSERAAIDAGANVIECDISMSSDGELFVLHDDDAKRLFNRPDVTNVEDLTIAELQAMPYDMTDGGAAAYHRLQIEGREKLSISGVEDVVRFDESCIVTTTSAGTLIITGEELHIGKLSLDGGEMQVDGRIDAVTYEDTEVRQGSFLSRLFG